MKLYAILFAHLSQKDREDGIKEYILSETEKEVFDYINRNYAYGMWTEDDYGEELTGSELKEQVDRLMECKGEMFDDYWDPSDLYYGATSYGWEEIDQNPEDCINLNFIKDITNE